MSHNPTFDPTGERTTDQPWNTQRRYHLGCSERKKEIRRRRKRREQVDHLKKRLGKATKSEQVEIARKLREMTPGAEVLITNWQLIAVDR